MNEASLGEANAPVNSLLSSRFDNNNGWMSMSLALNRHHFTVVDIQEACKSRSPCLHVFIPGGLCLITGLNLL